MEVVQLKLEEFEKLLESYILEYGSIKAELFMKLFSEDIIKELERENWEEFYRKLMEEEEYDIRYRGSDKRKER